jgi:hypothetical protein
MLRRSGAASFGPGRRDFLKGSTLALGVLAAEGCDTSTAAVQSTGGSRVASFGWEVTNLNNNGADMYVKVISGMTLNTVDIDVSLMLFGGTPAPGFAEVLCLGGVSRQAPPTINNAGSHAFINFPASTDFGAVAPDNPNNLNLVFDGSLSQDQFLAVILKTWVASDGIASSTSRHVTSFPNLVLNVGDYLAFHIDHGGVGIDAEMQVVLNYSNT